PDDGARPALSRAHPRNWSRARNEGRHDGVDVVSRAAAMRVGRARGEPMLRMQSFVAVTCMTLALGVPGDALAQPKRYTLESSEGLTLHNVAGTPATLGGRKGLKLTLAPSATG